MTSTRRLAILAQSGTAQGVTVGYRGLTHHEAATSMSGLLERRSGVMPQANGMTRLVIRYHLTEQGRRYLEVMQPSAVARVT